MAGAGEPAVRSPAVAGMFYPADAEQCRRAAQSLLQGQRTEIADEGRSWRGAGVPHAGWICSGAIAAQAIALLARSVPAPDLVVGFGAVPTPIDVDFAAFDSHASWAVPGGESRLATGAANALASGKSVGGRSDLFAVEDRLHRHEHAVEVELPLIQQAWPN